MQILLLIKIFINDMIATVDNFVTGDGWLDELSSSAFYFDISIHFVHQ